MTHFRELSNSWSMARDGRRFLSWDKLAVVESHDKMTEMSRITFMDNKRDRSGHFRISSG